MDSYKLSDLRGIIRKQFNNIETVITNIRTDQSNLINRSKDFSLPWDLPRVAQLLNALKLASLTLARGYMAAAMEEITKIRVHVPAVLRNKQLTVLGETVRFMQNVHMVVGGLDTETQHLFESLADKWRQLVAEPTLLQPATEPAEEQQQVVAVIIKLQPAAEVAEQQQQQQVVVVVLRTIELQPTAVAAEV